MPDFDTCCDQLINGASTFWNKICKFAYYISHALIWLMFSLLLPLIIPSVDEKWTSSQIYKNFLLIIIAQHLYRIYVEVIYYKVRKKLSAPTTLIFSVAWTVLALMLGLDITKTLNYVIQLVNPQRFVDSNTILYVESFFVATGIFFLLVFQHVDLNELCNAELSKEELPDPLSDKTKKVTKDFNADRLKQVITDKNDAA